MQVMRIICVFIFPFLLVGCSQTKLIYLKDAELARSIEAPEYPFLENRADAVKLLLCGHYVKAGGNLVLLIRKFDTGKVFTIDDEIYEKLSIEVKNFWFGLPINISSPDVSFYYSTGSSGFIYKGNGLYSSSGSGEITINKFKKNKMVVHLNISIFAKPAGVFPFEAKTIQIKDTLVFDEKKISDLTPWLGLPDPSIGKEVYPWKK